MLPDTRILTRHRDYCVLCECQGIVFRDQSTTQLHAVRKFAIDEMFIRALQIGDHWFIVDLRAIQRSLAVDIAQAPPRDTSGVILYTLRDAYASAAEFYKRVLDNHLDIWVADVMPQSQMQLELSDISLLAHTERAQIQAWMKSRDRFSEPYLGRAA